MVAIFEAEKVAPLDADEMLERVSAIQAPRGSDAFMAQAAHYLQRFSASGHVIRRHIEAKGGLAEARHTFAPPQTFALALRDGLGLRANVWPRIRPMSGFADQETLMYAYDLPHNHDFTFLTVGHHGEGYETDLYEVDPQAISGEPDQPVEMKSRSREQLSEGKVIAFSAYSDVHTQFPPASLSVSINLVLVGKARGQEQVFFDTARSVVVGGVEDGAVGRMKLTIDMAAAFPTEETEDMLRAVAATSPYARLRTAAEGHLARWRGPFRSEERRAGA
jgi:hypothetical protein